MLACKRGVTALHLASTGAAATRRTLSVGPRPNGSCLVRRLVVRPLAASTVMSAAAQQQAVSTWQQGVPYISPSQDKDFVVKYTASCMCGDVQYAVDCDPVAAKYCHCTSCQRLHGADKLTFLNSSDMSSEHILPCKVSCSRCHSPMADEGRNMWMSFPTLFKFSEHIVPEAFKPTDHIFYKQRCMDIKDGKKKWSKHQGESELIND